MEILKIEKLEKLRFNLMLLRTISFIVVYSCVILIEFPRNSLMSIVVMVLISLFGLLFTYAVIRASLLNRKIAKEPILKQALMNEMYISFEYKAMATGYYTMIIIVTLLFVLIYFFDIPTKISTLLVLVLYTGMIVTDVHRLFLYK